MCKNFLSELPAQFRGYLMIDTQVSTHGQENHIKRKREHLLPKCAWKWPIFERKYYDI